MEYRELISPPAPSLRPFSFPGPRWAARARLLASGTPQGRVSRTGWEEGDNGGQGGSQGLYLQISTQCLDSRVSP